MNIAEIITKRILEKLESGTVPWHQPWANDEAPKNLITKKEYRGINVFMLACAGFASPFWASYKQIKELGGNVNKGEKGWPVVFWKFMDKDDPEDNKKHIPLLRYYTVFNADQTSGINEKKIPEAAAKYNKMEKLEQCAAVVRAMPQRPEITCNDQRAYYTHSKDRVNMPQMEAFDGAEEYYSTLFHELTHNAAFLIMPHRYC